MCGILSGLCSLRRADEVKLVPPNAGLSLIHDVVELCAWTLHNVWVLERHLVVLLLEADLGLWSLSERSTHFAVAEDVVISLLLWMLHD